eukprot:TRINITY_DN20774_c0_g1_i1.p1 TRINITY_DN20774_c0_g1~~TRINITY_DN20774_c0_g1_i1.p1  ORF type:complete len:223 (-),score=22.71 TRINITY_DN20774_c0_g1_i1:394-1062(-)
MPASSSTGWGTIEFEQAVGHAEDVRALADVDIPKTDAVLPENITIKRLRRGARFDVGLDELNLLDIYAKARNATYNPRRAALVRLYLPTLNMHVSIARCGAIRLQAGPFEDEELREAANTVTEVIKHCDHPEATCSNFELESCEFTADVRFPIRLEALFKKWSRHMMYDPDVTPLAVFYLEEPRCTASLFHTGKIKLSGVQDEQAARRSMQILYPLLREASR